MRNLSNDISLSLLFNKPILENDVMMMALTIVLFFFFSRSFLEGNDETDGTVKAVNMIQKKCL